MFVRKKTTTTGMVTGEDTSPGSTTEVPPEPAVSAVSTGGDECNVPSPPPQRPPSDIPQPGGDDIVDRLVHWFKSYVWLMLALLGFYALADYTAYTTSEQRPGQLVFSNSMTQLWTACYRMAFILTASLVLLRLFWPDLFRFIRPDSPDQKGMTSRFHELTFHQQVCVCLLAFFGLCLLFVLLLSVNLEQTVSIGR